VLQIELLPDLSHCIETVAKREYREAAGRLLAAGEGNEELQERIEILRLFLETADFNGLRRESERHLVEGRKVKFVVCLEEGKPRYEMQVW
jgi:hypothetical protein